MLIPGTRHDWKRKCKVEAEVGEMLRAMMRASKAGLLFVKTLINILISPLIYFVKSFC